MSGGTNYTLDFNGLVFDSKESDITLTLEKGFNTIKIKADAECQGTYEKTIFIAEDPIYYPNPFEDYLTVLIGNGDSKEVMINIYNQGGQLVLSKLQAVQDGSVRIKASHLSAGIYSVSLKTNSSKTTFKIIKK